MTARPTLDWPALLRAGLQTLRLRPSEFWSLTPAELALLLGLDLRAGALTRDAFAALAALHPDQGATP